MFLTLLLLFLYVVSNNGHFVIFLLNSTPIIFSSLWAFLLGGNPGVLNTKGVQVLFLGYGIKVLHVSVSVCFHLLLWTHVFVFFFFFNSLYLSPLLLLLFSEVQIVFTLTIKASSIQLLWPIDLTLLIFEQFFLFSLADFPGLPCTSLLQTYDQPCL